MMLQSCNLCARHSSSGEEREVCAPVCSPDSATPYCQLEGILKKCQRLRSKELSVSLRGECPASLGRHKCVPFHLGAPLAAEREKKPLSRAVFVLPWVESTETSEGPRCFVFSLMCFKEAVAALWLFSGGCSGRVCLGHSLERCFPLGSMQHVPQKMPSFPVSLHQVD